ncbi:replication initiation protein repB3 (plasmid) [Butyrivibrio proteoclasticus B316]|uniref:Replication initiation protein repB3 n=1 Tax=Butyrivibrio proteoclasticus (strain ATCC 51982 / DSM 14932 / B316) TaxID=515622 RepID=E0S4N4_BUTPB|nr:replication initiation protein [Butyrivibrio proteoclasticus]ADL36366.1 replication initiation protein repB3 [Butyrivibrio proteoclasticus B316]
MAKKKDESYDLSILRGRQYSKSNSLINAKGTTSLLAQKIFSVGIQQAQLDESTGQLITTLHGGDLRRIFGNKGGSFYEHIRDLVEPEKDKASLLDWRIIYTNDSTKELEALNVVTDCKFKDGILEMRYNNRITDQLYQLKENYTMFSLEETIPLKSIYSYRIYEILKSEFDKQSYLAHKRGENLDNSEPYMMVMNLTDLKLRLGIIDPNENKEIYNALKKSNVDFDYIEQLSQKSAERKKDKDASNTGKPKYSVFSTFRKNTLDKAKEELDEMTSIRFEYEPVKSGRGGKIHSIRFFIYDKKKTKVEVVEKKIVKVLTPEEKDEFIDSLNEIIEERLKMKDLRAIAEAAEYDLSKVEKAYRVMSSKSSVNDITAFMISAIKGGYEEPVKKTTQFNKYEQRADDFVELEKILLDN